MPATLNPIAVSKYKKARVLENKTIEESLLRAGYTPKTARHRNSACKLAIIGEAEILRDIEKETTVKEVLEELEELRILATTGKDFSTATRCVELKGKWLAMFTDKSEVATVEKDDAQFSLERLSRIKSLS